MAPLALGLVFCVWVVVPGAGALPCFTGCHEGEAEREERIGHVCSVHPGGDRLTQKGRELPRPLVSD